MKVGSRIKFRKTLKVFKIGQQLQLCNFGVNKLQSQTCPKFCFYAVAMFNVSI